MTLYISFNIFVPQIFSSEKWGGEDKVELDQLALKSFLAQNISDTVRESGKASWKGAYLKWVLNDAV